MLEFRLLFHIFCVAENDPEIQDEHTSGEKMRLDIGKKIYFLLHASEWNDALEAEQDC